LVGMKSSSLLHTVRSGSHSVHTLNGAAKSLAGSITTARTRAKAPCTATPRIRNGSRISQTKGYTISASKARGQQITNSRHQRRKPSMCSDLLRSSVVYAAALGEVPLGFIED